MSHWVFIPESYIGGSDETQLNDDTRQDKAFPLHTVSSGYSLANCIDFSLRQLQRNT